MSAESSRSPRKRMAGSVFIPPKELFDDGAGPLAVALPRGVVFDRARHCLAHFQRRIAIADGVFCVGCVGGSRRSQFDFVLGLAGRFCAGPNHTRVCHDHFWHGAISTLAQSSLAMDDNSTQRTGLIVGMDLLD